jgi:hypothetical protein
MIRTNGIYPWSFVTQIFRNSYPDHGGDRKTNECQNENDETNVIFIRHSFTYPSALLYMI